MLLECESVLSSKPIRDEGRLIICRIAVGERERERTSLCNGENACLYVASIQTNWIQLKRYSSNSKLKKLYSHLGLWVERITVRSRKEGLRDCWHFFILCDDCKQVFPEERKEPEMDLCPIRVVECHYYHSREENLNEIKIFYILVIVSYCWYSVYTDKLLLFQYQLVVLSYFP